MNYVYMLIEIVVVFLLIVTFYRINKKDGLFQCISLLSSIASIMMYKTITIISFDISLGIPLTIGIFICSNIIIQKYGEDEITKIIKTFIFGYLIGFIFINLIGITSSSKHNLIGNVSFNNLFGYNLNILRTFVAGFISISFMLWYNGNLYNFLKKSQNKIVFSNIVSILIIQFIESILFIIISYFGMFDLIQLFGMIVIRYILNIIIGIFSLIPFYRIIRMRDI